MMKHLLKVNTHAILACLFFGISQTALAQQLYTENASGSDSWNNGGNWAAAVPSGADSASITAGDQAQVQNAATLSYSGSLTLNANSILRLNNTGGLANANALGGSMILNAGSQVLLVISQNLNFPAITLAGDATFNSTSNASHHNTRSFPAAIGGAGQLTLAGVNNNTFHLNVANSFSGGLIANSPNNQGWRIEANAVGSLGSGDVTINNTITLQLDASDVIGDAATLTLNGSKDSRKASKLILSGTDTIGAFVIDGVDQCVGTFNSTTHPGVISGTGSITVPIPIGGDLDGDGTLNEDDCAPCDNTIPGPEICDGKDNDCDGLIDEGLVGCVNTMTTAGTWGVGGNWSLGTMPVGDESAVVNTGIAASATTSPTFSYTGGLTLNANASLRLQNATAVNALSTSVKMNTGSSITVPQAAGASNTTFPAIELLGNVSFNAQSHHRTHTFPSLITGAGALTITNSNNTTIRITTANSFSGGLTMVNGSSRIEANANGALGTGDVNINANTSLQIGSGLSSVINDGAALHLNGNRDNRKAAKLILNSSETVDTFFIDGIQKLAATYSSADGLTDSGGNALISGAGSLTVLTGPPVVAPILTSVTDDVFGGPIYQDHPGLNFTFTFDQDMDELTVDASDFENGGTATITVGAVTETAAGVFNVPVTLTAAGTLLIQVKSGVTVEAATGAALDTTAAVPDDTTITVNAGTPPDTTITGTAGGTDSWNTDANWDLGVPFGSANALVGAGVTAQVDVAPRAYTGNLTLLAGARLDIRSTAAKAAIPSSPRTLTFHENSTLVPYGNFGGGSLTFGPVALLGAFTLNGTPADRSTFTFAEAVTGAGSISMTADNSNIFRFSVANSYSGGTTVSNSAYIDALADGALGTGDATVNANSSLRINAGLSDVIADAGSLYLAGAKSSELAAKVVLGSSETVKLLYFDGVSQVGGTWGSTASGAANINDTQFSGNGVLTVIGGATVVRIR